MNPYLATLMAFQRARGIPMGAPAGSIAGRMPNPAYQQAYYQAPQQGPAAGVGIAGGALSQADIQHARDLACRMATYLVFQLGTDGAGLVASLTAMCFPDSKGPQVKSLVSSHLSEWCPDLFVPRPHGPGGPPVPYPHG